MMCLSCRGHGHTLPQCEIWRSIYLTRTPSCSCTHSYLRTFSDKILIMHSSLPVVPPESCIGVWSYSCRVGQPRICNTRKLTLNLDAIAWILDLGNESKLVSEWVWITYFYILNHCENLLYLLDFLFIDKSMN